MDTEFHLYKEGSEYVRIEQGDPVKVTYNNKLCFTKNGDVNPKLTIDTSVTTSA
jgi:hypothetical protein